MGSSSELFYIPEELFGASEWIRSNSGPSDALLSSAATGSMVPFLTGRYVYVGHWSETVRYFDKLLIVQRFYRGELTEDEVKELFLKNRIKYVLYTSYERALGTRGIDRYSPLLKKEFEKENVVVYRIIQ